MKITILSLFPSFFVSPLGESILGRAIDEKLVSVELIDIRNYAEGKHHKVDDRPYGGGPGMVMMPGPVARAIRSHRTDGSLVVYLSPEGEPFKAAVARKWASGVGHLILLCGHYEGVDQRVIDSEVDQIVSIGDFVLTNGCPAALVVLDALVRFIPGVLGDKDSCHQDSFENEGWLDCPHFTRPDLFEGKEVPEVLKSGDHAKISAWRKEQSRLRTKRIRPDLL